MNQQHAIAACLLAVLPSAFAGAPAATIELRPDVAATGPAVTLGQMARLQSADLALIRQLANLPLGRAPTQGASVLVEREAIAAWLRRRLGVAPEQIEWRGVPASRVTASTQSVDGEQIAAAASRALGQWLAERSARSEAQLAIAPRSIEVARGELRLQPRALGQGRMHSRMTVWVDVWVADRFVRVVPVTFAVEAWGDAVTAIAPLQAGAVLEAGTTERRSVDLAASDAAPVPAGVVRTRRAVAAGEIVRAHDVEPLPAVVRGQWAVLRSGAGAVSSESRVQVLQDGRLGDSVRVRPPAATASLLARVTGAGQLEVAR